MTEILFDANEDWEKRVLCSDESCIGTVGPDGKCKECGKPYESALPDGNGQGALQTPAPAEEKSDRKSTRLNSSHLKLSRMPSSA